MAGFYPGNVPTASLHLPVGSQGQLSTACDSHLNIIGTYYVQSMVTTGRERLGFKSKYGSRARSLKPGTTLARVLMTMAEGTRER